MADSITSGFHVTVTGEVSGAQVCASFPRSTSFSYISSGNCVFIALPLCYALTTALFPWITSPMMSNLNVQVLPFLRVPHTSPSNHWYFDSSMFSHLSCAPSSWCMISPHPILFVLAFFLSSLSFPIATFSPCRSLVVMMSIVNIHLITV